jgi:Cu-processing system permease protein
MQSFLLSSWRSGFRGRGFYALLVLSVLLVSGAFLAGLTSPRQPQTVVLDIGVSSLRFSLVLFSLLWVQELVGREIERRTVILTFAYPVSKLSYVLGRFFGIAALLLAATLVFGMLLWLVVLFSGGGYPAAHPPQLGFPFWVALLGIWVDALVVTAFVVALSAVATVSALPLAIGAAFALAAKMIGPVFDYLKRGADGMDNLVNTYGPIVNAARYVLPDLSRLDWRDWPMYGTAPTWGGATWALVMAAGYSACMIAFAARALSRREFS